MDSPAFRPTPLPAALARVGLPATACAVLLSLAARGAAQSCTNVFGGPVVAQAWTAARSPYCIHGDITVSLLTIEPGVTVRMKGPYRIDILTSITAVGTEAAPITFTTDGPNSPWRGMRFQNTPPTSTLRHCVFEFADDSALQITESTPVVDQCVFRLNTSSSGGGGIRISQATKSVALTGCVVSGNTTSRSHGGGIQAVMGSGTLQLVDCRITGNRARDSGYYNHVGGGIRVSGNSLFRRCVITGNEARGYQCNSPLGRGAGVYVDGDGTGVWENCLIGDNTVQVRAACSPSHRTDALGGGVFLRNGTLNVLNCIVAGNRLVVTKGTSAGHSGGGIYVHDGTFYSENCTIARNHREGIRRAGGNVTAKNTIVYENGGGGTQTSGGVSTSYCCIQNWAGGGTNISANPAFAGPREEIIVWGSPCVDAGDPGAAYADPGGSPGLGGSRNDIGAHGGPLAAGWNRQGKLLLAIEPNPIVTPSNVTFSTTGSDPRSPAWLLWVGANGNSTTPITMLSGTIVPSRRTDCDEWAFVLSVPAMASVELDFRSVSVDSRQQLLLSPITSVRIQ